MKIVNISTYDNGGAGRAAVRITESLRSIGEDAVLLVRNKKTKSEDVIEYCDSSFKRLIASVTGMLDEIISYKEIMYEEFGLNISRYSLILNADIIILHWTNHFISYKGLQKLIRLGKPIIWVMHDMWLLTGGCHFDEYCNKYQSGCGECPLIPLDNLRKDKTYKNFEKKKKLLEISGITVVSPSEWLFQCADKSLILEKCFKRTIHYPIDMELFSKIKQEVLIKEKYNIEKERKIIVFGAYKALYSQRKGYKYLVEACKYLSGDKYELVLYGNDDEMVSDELPLRAVLIGTLENDMSVVEMLSVADVFVAPSEQDNYPNAVLEALACGVPVVAFSIGGMTDLIEHKKNGYLCRYQDCGDLASGIEYCVDHKEELGQYARQKVEAENSYSKIGEEYQKLFQTILVNH